MDPYYFSAVFQQLRRNHYYVYSKIAGRNKQLEGVVRVSQHVPKEPKIEDRNFRHRTTRQYPYPARIC